VNPESHRTLIWMVWLSMFMGSNRNAYIYPHHLAPRGISELKFLSIPDDGVHMTMSMEHSMRYFQINTILWTAAQGSQTKGWVILNKKTLGGTEYINHRECQTQILKSYGWLNNIKCYAGWDTKRSSCPINEKELVLVLFFYLAFLLYSVLSLQ
jgi:hypothetical protein